LLDRVQVELDAIRNDIAEAREHPTQPLGVDLLSSSIYSTHSDQSTLSAVLQQFTLARMEIERYHGALTELVESDRP
jgi:hypothetical protein